VTGSGQAHKLMAEDKVVLKEKPEGLEENEVVVLKVELVGLIYHVIMKPFFASYSTMWITCLPVLHTGKITSAPTSPLSIDKNFDLSALMTKL